MQYPEPPTKIYEPQHSAPQPLTDNSAPVRIYAGNPRRQVTQEDKD